MNSATATALHRNIPELANSEVELYAPPSDEGAEQAVIGAIITDNDQYAEVIGIIETKDFYSARHQIIFEVMGKLLKDNRNVDLVSMKEYLDRIDQLGGVGGIAYLAKIQQNTPQTLNAKTYALIVRDKSILRGLLRSAHSIQKMVHEQKDTPARMVLNNAQRLVFDLDQSAGADSGPVQINEPVMAAFEQMESRHKNPRQDSITGVKSGLTDIDHVTSGFQPSDLIVIAGRPSMGKTALAMNIAENSVIVEKKTVLIFSLEMPAIQLAMRSLASVSGVNLKAIRDGNLGTGSQERENWEKVGHALDILSSAPLFIDATPGISPVEIVGRSQKLKRNHGLDLVIVDYLQLMQMKDTDVNRATELANITRELKFLAKDLNIPVIALSQINRAVETRPDKRPLMADLRESGAIEQDADLILFVYRDEMYKPNSKDKGAAEINIAKHRNGETKTVKLVFQKEFCHFDNYSDREDLDEIHDV